MTAAAALADSGSADARDQQWDYRPANDDTKQAYAVFLSWDYSFLLFRAWCEPHGRLKIRYYGDGAIRLTKTDQIALILDERGRTMKTTLDRDIGKYGTLTGELALSADLRRAIALTHNIDIDAPNEMGEQWYTGSGNALKAIVRNCR